MDGSQNSGASLRHALTEEIQKTGWSSTFTSSGPAHVPSVWLNNEVHHGAPGKEALHCLQVSSIDCVLYHQVLTYWCPQAGAGPQRRAIPGFLPQQVAAEVIGGQLLPVLVPIQQVLVMLQRAQGRGSEDNAVP